MWCRQGDGILLCSVIPQDFVEICTFHDAIEI